MGLSREKVNAATGGMFTTVKVALETFSSPALSVTVRATVYVPFLVKTWVGFCMVEISPSPKSQYQVFLYNRHCYSNCRKIGSKIRELGYQDGM